MLAAPRAGLIQLSDMCGEVERFLAWEIDAYAAELVASIGTPLPCEWAFADDIPTVEELLQAVASMSLDLERANQLALFELWTLLPESVANEGQPPKAEAV